MGGKAWAAKRKQYKAVAKKETLIVTDLSFFYTPTGQVGWDEDILKQVHEKWERVSIFAPKDFCDSWGMTFNTFASFVSKRHFSNVKIIVYDSLDRHTATDIWRQHIIDLGGIYRPAKNPREVVYLNLERYFRANHITWVGPTDHKKARVEITLPKTFKDYESIRKKNAEW